MVGGHLCLLGDVHGVGKSTLDSYPNQDSSVPSLIRSSVIWLGETRSCDPVRHHRHPRAAHRRSPAIPTKGQEGFIVEPVNGGAISKGILACKVQREYMSTCNTSIPGFGLKGRGKQTTEFFWGSESKQIGKCSPNPRKRLIGASIRRRSMTMTSATPMPCGSSDWVRF